MCRKTKKSLSKQLQVKTSAYLIYLVRTPALDFNGLAKSNQLKYPEELYTWEMYVGNKRKR